VILSSHIVSDVEAAATSIAIMNKGHLVAHSAPESLIRSVQGRVWEVTVASSSLPELRRTHIVGSTVRTGEGARARVVGEQAPGPTAEPATPTLEDAYLHLLAGDSDAE
jgi:ABC-type multidrug transport system ATPase subunit